MSSWALSDVGEKEVHLKLKELIENLQSPNIVDPYAIGFKVDARIGPYHIKEVLEQDFGYTQEEQETNGWEMDYWIHMQHSTLPPICIRGTAIIHDMQVTGESLEYMAHQNTFIYPEFVKQNEYIQIPPGQHVDFKDKKLESLLISTTKLLDEVDELLKETETDING